MINGRPVVLCACEESGTCCKAFRLAGCEAWSVDIRPNPSTPLSEYHIIGDALQFRSGYEFNGQRLVPGDNPFDLVLAFPPCTYLTKAGRCNFFIPQVNIDRFFSRVSAAQFFLEFFRFNSKRLCVENPPGCMSQFFRSPDQIIHPAEFVFDDSPLYSKPTCLWLVNLPPLIRHEVQRQDLISWVMSGSHDSVRRSRFHSCVAEAMADQWIGFLKRGID